MQTGDTGQPRLGYNKGGRIQCMAGGGLIERLFGSGKPETVTEKYARQDAELAAKQAKNSPKATEPASKVISGSALDPATALKRREAAAGLAKGGKVPGKSPHPRADNIPIMATAGEFMVQEPAVRKLEKMAPGLLKSLNAMGDGESPKPKLGAVRHRGGKRKGYEGGGYITPAERLRQLNTKAAAARVAQSATGNLTSSLGAAPDSNAIKFAIPPEPIAATTSPGAAPMPTTAVPPAGQRIAPQQAVKFTGDPLYPNARGPAPAMPETAPRPIVGGPTIPGAAPSADPQAVRRGTGFTVADPAKAPGVMQRLGAVARNSAGPGMLALSAVPEQLDVAKVAANPAATGIDVGTQQAQGAARWAGAGLGAATGGALGMATGPAAPILAPLGAIAGGAYGYWAANKATEGGRQALGADPRAPVDQLPAAAAAPQLGVGITRPYPENASNHTLAPRIGAQALADSIASARNPNGQVTRIGNSYSGAPGISGDIQINGRGPTGGAITAQDNAAADALAARYGQKSGFGVATQGTGTVSSMDTSQGYAQDLRDIARLQSERNPQVDPVQALINNGKPMTTKKAAAIAALQAGATAAESSRETAALAKKKAGTDAEGAAMDNKAKARLGVLQEALFNAKTPKEQAAAEEKLMAFQGKRGPAPVRAFAVPGGQAITAQGVPYTTPSRVYDPDTKTFIDPPGTQGGQRPQIAEGSISEVNGKRAKYIGGKWVPQ